MLAVSAYFQRMPSKNSCSPQNWRKLFFLMVRSNAINTSVQLWAMELPGHGSAFLIVELMPDEQARSSKRVGRISVRNKVSFGCLCNLFFCFVVLTNVLTFDQEGATACKLVNSLTVSNGTVTSVLCSRLHSHFNLVCCALQSQRWQLLLLIASTYISWTEQGMMARR